ncbi:MAG: hypothetical protein DCC71_18500 [Proteobacteria bacterium]|nr:MAG: hypothetical protein DCC71_18500 [Pseudomonadota bacterium]
MLRRLVVAGFVCLAPFAARAESADAIARQLDERFGAACSAGDVEAVLALYADDASVIFPTEGAVAHGKSEIAALVPGECRADSRVVMRLDEVRAHELSPKHISAIGRWTLTSAGPDGKPVVTTVRTSELLVKTDAGWRFLVDHASVGAPPPPPVPAPPAPAP